MAEAVIVSTARTPMSKSVRGLFNNTHGITLAGHAMRRWPQVARRAPPA